jgi:hypothetical protein
MAINFNSFTEGTTSNIQSNDYVVGFGDTNPGGERKWTVSTIANAVLSANSVGATQITNGSVIAAKLGTTEQKQICKAWVNFDGENAFSPNPSTIAIRSSYNVSSVTKNGTGSYTLNFTTSMSDANYNTTASCVGAGTALGDANNWASCGPINVSTAKVLICDVANVLTNSPTISIQVFGN